MLGQDWHVLDLILVQKGVSRCTSDNQVTACDFGCCRAIIQRASPQQPPRHDGEVKTQAKCRALCPLACCSVPLPTLCRPQKENPLFSKKKGESPRQQVYLVPSSDPAAEKPEGRRSLSAFVYC